MNITLVFPGIEGSGFDSFGNRAYSIESYMIHHGLCSLSACLKQAGHSVELIDLRKLKNWAHFRKIVAEDKSPVLGITMMSLDFRNVVKAAGIIKEIDPGKSIIVGGVHPTVATDEVAAVSDFDYIVRREGEITFPKLIEAIEKGKASERIVDGVHPELDAIPFIDRDLFDKSGELSRPFYDEHFDLEPPFVTIISGRGCMYNCSFCQPAEKQIFGRRVRRRSVDNFMRELEELRERFAFRSLMIHDDCMLEEKKWVLEFCREYRRRGFDQPFFCQGRADIICRNEDMMEALAETGLKVLSIGFESGSQKILKVLRKGLRVEDNFKASDVCRKYGIKIYGNYMFGVPTETPEDMLETARLIRHNRADVKGIGYYNPSPGSDLHDYCLENGLCLKPGDYIRSMEPRIKGIDYHAAQKAIDYALSASLRQRVLRRAAYIPVLRKIRNAIKSIGPAESALKWLRNYVYNRN